MIKTKIIIEYDGFLSKSDLGKLLMQASSYDNFIFLEVQQPGGKVTYSCEKENKNDC